MILKEKHSWLYDLLFVFVLLMAGTLRLAGYNWGEGYHQHPDELFLTGVLENLRAHTCIDPLVPVDACGRPEQRRWMTIGEYFNSDTSTLNPYNRGHAFFVYGNLPMTLVRVAFELFSEDSLLNPKYFARQMSALADLFTIFLLYWIVSRLYGRKVALFASAFSALAVMQIQQSHFFTSDLFVNLFMFLALLFAVGIVDAKTGQADPVLESGSDSSQPGKPGFFSNHFQNRLFLLSAGFGLALGMAMASKINAAAMAVVLPGAFAVRYLMHDRDAFRQNLSDYGTKILLFLMLGGLATIVSFRIFQPYAFDGIGLNEQWVKNISEQRAQASGDSDLPWNLQWARRTHLYSFVNLTVWGLGLPLGILSWIGFIFMGWRIFKGEYKHLLLWGWTAFYFLWQSLQFNPTMRYQLPIYPLLAMMAAWFILEFPTFKIGRRTRFNLPAVLVCFSGISVLILTAAWALAFQGIYLRDETRMAASRWIFQNVKGPVNLSIETTGQGTYRQPLSIPTGMWIQAGTPYDLSFTPNVSGQLSRVVLGHATDTTPGAVVVTLVSASAPDRVLAQASELLDPALTADPRGPSLTLTLDRTVPVEKDQSYQLKIETLGSSLALTGDSFANETDYDWGLPFRIDGYDPFGGMYRGDLNLQVYWADDTAKLTRFVDTLSAADYIIIPTNHQYAQITRLPERYPLTTHYYRELLGCPASEDVISCYRAAQPGQYKGTLGFELTAVFESYPTLGSWKINDQAAEEAFTFYDHPKVLIFKKTDDFRSADVFGVLSAVNLSSVVPLTPRQAAGFKDLMLPDTRLASQQSGGTWSELFDYDWLQNKVPFAGMLLWYAFIFVLGVSAYPITRLALPGLKHHAYPLSRIVGLALLAWLSWMGGSVGVPYTRTSIGLAAALIAVTGLGLWVKRREEFKEEWTTRRRFFVLAEIVFLSFFLIDLLIRLGNSDMWHPSKGGERPMDFSYFNAVLKSSSFPPYDPWYAGGYINYYYYGFVLAGTPVKLLGIVPSIAYNFILPTWFAMLAAGAFVIGYSLLDSQTVPQKEERASILDLRLAAGLSASFMTVLFGNLGTIQMIFNALQRMAAPAGSLPLDATLFQRWGWAFQGLWKILAEQAVLPIGRGDWYWFPSRVIPAGPGNEITEFPLFTFLYSDLHAHMLGMPLAMFIIAWSLSFVRSRAQLTRGQWAAVFGIGALMIGALKPTNTWDLYTYYLLAAISIAYTWMRYLTWKPFAEVSDTLWKAGGAAAAAVLLYGLGALFYLPFSSGFGQSYNSVDWWEASRTPFSSYFTQWGVFLFIITAWLIWETREWMAATPVSHLNRLKNHVVWIEVAIAAFIALLVFFAVDGVRIGFVALPLAFWAAILLILNAKLPDTKRFILFLTGTALVITIAVELVSLVGDIGRMNTIFKLYLQAWLMFAVSAAAALGWLLPALPYWKPRWSIFFQSGLYLLLAGAFLFTFTAASDKIADRMTVEAPRTLDGMTYMNYSQYWDVKVMDLSQDYRAIRWLQDHVQGSPVIVEANCSEYRWCTRMTIYTGLPGVVGWNWHQRQQRGTFSIQVQERVNEVGAFYNTPEVQAARSFIKKYQVRYIIVGQLERNLYPPVEGLPDGLEKFEQFDGIYWREVYHDGATTIYEVIQ